MVHSRRIPAQGPGKPQRVLHFGHAGLLYRQSFVMYDRETGSLWNHSTGLCMKGPLQGSQLRILPARMTRWQRWRALHPQTRVLLGPRNEGFMGSFLRARADAYGLAVSFGMHSRLVPYTVLREREVVNDRFRGVPYVFVFDPRDRTSFAFRARLGQRVLHFEPASEPGAGPRMRDRETGSLWDRMGGTALSGELRGQHLEPALGVPWLVQRWRAIYGEGASLYAPAATRASEHPTGVR